MFVGNWHLLPYDKVYEKIRALEMITASKKDNIKSQYFYVTKPKNIHLVLCQ